MSKKSKNIAVASVSFYNMSGQVSNLSEKRSAYPECYNFLMKEDPMGDKGSKDKGRKENKKKPKLTQKERKKLKEEKKKNK